MQFKEDQTEQKLRGGYYTPQKLASFICKWVNASNKVKTILEPSCGDGVFLEGIAKTRGRTPVEVHAFEIEATEAIKAKKRAEAFKNVRAKISTNDFLAWAVATTPGKTHFDAVVGNPPFIRYQYLPTNSQELAEKIFLRHNLEFTKHTNAWVPFVVASLALLNPGGKFGMVLPTEIFHVMHAQSLRSYFGRVCKRTLIFDPQDLWFDSTLQGAVIVLAEKKMDISDKGLGISMVSTSGVQFTELHPDSFFEQARFLNGKTVQGKWTRALLEKRELDVFEAACENRGVHQFDEIANVDVGVVTGANDFFLVPDDVVRTFRLQKWAHPMFGRSGHCPGIVYDKKQHIANSNLGHPTNFLWFNVNSYKELPVSARRYIEQGEKRDLHMRYKCRVREPWFKVPSVYASALGMLKRAHDVPRLILNRMSAFTTDTAYRITTTIIKPEKFVYCFINSLTALSAELEGRHYGGGVLELVPSEIEQLRIPLPQKISYSLSELDDQIKKVRLSHLLQTQDRKILTPLGFSRADQEILFSGWNRLRMRRQRISEVPITNQSVKQTPEFPAFCKVASVC